MSELLHFSEHRLQEVALAIMACVYTLRIIWLLHFKAGRDRQAPARAFKNAKAKGILYSWMNIAMPWAMESTRTQALLYIQFVIFHLGVVFAIGLSFIIPYAPQLLEFPLLSISFQLVTVAAFLVSVLRLYRRISNKFMRAISSPDDYFSLCLLTIWFLFASLAVPNRPQEGENILLTFFILTAFFLIYVPFSKISHYLYYPFTRYYFGKTMGHRGVFPIQRVPQQRGMKLPQASDRWLGAKDAASDNIHQ
jgi:nitrate reductase gamma subunit